jgi:nucleoside-diphosphate-sugar epimerase
MYKILITGSLGYLGSVLSKHLTEHGYDCIGCDIGFFKDNLLYPSQDSSFILKDARDLSEKDLKGIGVVVHLAGISNDPMGNLDPASVYDPTREYSLEIARLCRGLGIRFIFASSCSVYGIGDEERLCEESQTHPQTHYSLNKIQIEKDLAELSGSDFSPIALRFATVFGLSPRIRFDVVINMLVGMALADGKVVLNSDGSAWRPNLHILDACEAIRRSIQFNYQEPELLVLNVGADENNLQVIEVAETICKLVPGSEIKFLDENPDLDQDGLIRDRKINEGKDRRTYRVSFEKIKQVLPTFICNWSIEEGIQNMIEGFKSIEFNSLVFKHRGFYRLQHLENLFEDKLITDDLKWKTPPFREGLK